MSNILKPTKMSILSTIDNFYFLNLKWFSQKSLQCRERQFLCFGNKERIGMSVGLLVGFDTNFKKLPKMIYAP